MTIPHDAATALTARRAARFAPIHDEVLAHAAGHGCGLEPLSPVDLREVEVLTRATHSSYVLELGAGAGEATLHIAAAFGRTGRLEAVEPDSAHADLIELVVRRYALEQVVRVNRTSPTSVVPALSGPYDLIVAHEGIAALAAIYEDLVRVLRTGGSLLLRIPAAERVPGATGEGGLLQRLAQDPRMAPWFSPTLDRVLATRIR